MLKEEQWWRKFHPGCSKKIDEINLELKMMIEVGSFDPEIGENNSHGDEDNSVENVGNSNEDEDEGIEDENSDDYFTDLAN